MQSPTEALEFLRIQYDDKAQKFVVYYSRGADNAKYFAETFQAALKLANKVFSQKEVR